MNAKALLVFLVTSFALIGCANTTQQHFDSDRSKSLASKTVPTNPSRSTVYLMREWALGQGFLPPLFYAVNDVMVSTMPLGAYVPLSLEPGPHTFSRFTVTLGGGLARFGVVRADVELNLLPGFVYYVSEVNAFTDTFRVVDPARGQAIDLAPVFPDTAYAQCIAGCSG